MADKVYTIVINAKGEPALKLMKDINKEGEKFVDTQGDVTKATNKRNKSTREQTKQDKGAAQLTANQTKAFSKLSQQLGGIVPIYAQVAANVFAITAAFGALERAADFQILIDSADSLAIQTGRSLTGLGQSMKDITGSAISMKEAMTQASIAASAGFDNSTIEELTQVARNASVALGREMTDSLNRVFKGAIKAEPELLDELGIILRLETAANKYAIALNKNAKNLTTFEKQQAVVNEVLEQGQKKFGRLSEIDPNPLTQLSSAFSDVTTQILALANSPLGEIFSFFAENTTALTAAIVLMASAIAKQALPSIAGLGTAIVESFVRQGDMFTRMAQGAQAFSDRVHRARASVDELTQSAIKTANISKDSSVYGDIMDKANTSSVRLGKTLNSLRGALGETTKQMKKAGGLSPELFIKRQAIRQAIKDVDSLDKEIANMTKTTKIANQVVRGTAGAFSLMAGTVSTATAAVAGFAGAMGNASKAVAAAVGIGQIYKAIITSIVTAAKGHGAIIGFAKGTGAALGGIGTALFKLVPIIAGVTVAWQILGSAMGFIKDFLGFEDIARVSEKLQTQKDALEKSALAANHYKENIEQLPNTLDNINEKLQLQSNILQGLAGDLGNVVKALDLDKGFGFLDNMLDAIGLGGLDELKDNLQKSLKQLDDLGLGKNVNEELRQIINNINATGDASVDAAKRLLTLQKELERFTKGAKEGNQALIDGMKKLSKATVKLQGELPSLGGVDQTLVQVENIISRIEGASFDTIFDVISGLTSLDIKTLGLNELSKQMQAFTKETILAEEKIKVLQSSLTLLLSARGSDAAASRKHLIAQIEAIEAGLVKQQDAIEKGLVDPLKAAREEFTQLSNNARNLQVSLQNLKLDKINAGLTGTASIQLLEKETKLRLQGLAVERNAIEDAQTDRKTVSKEILDDRKKLLKELNTYGEKEQEINKRALEIRGELHALNLRNSDIFEKDKQAQLALDKTRGKGAETVQKLYSSTTKEINKIVQQQAMGVTGLQDKYNVLNTILKDSVQYIIDNTVKTKEWGDSILYAQKAAEETQKFLAANRIDPTAAMHKQAYGIETNIILLEKQLELSNKLNGGLYDRADAQWLLNDAIIAGKIDVAESKSIISGNLADDPTISPEMRAARQEAHNKDVENLEALQRVRQAGLDQNIAALALSADTQASVMQAELGFLQQKARLGSLFNKADADALKIAKLRAKLKGNTPEDIKRLVDLQKKLNKESRKFEFAKELQEAAESMNDLADGMKKVFNAMRNDDSFDDLGASLILLRDIGADIDNPLGKFTEGLATAGLAAENYSQQMAGIQEEREQAYQDGTLDRLKAENLELAETQANYGLIANAAGGLAQAFEEGSGAAKAFTLVQQGAAIASAAAAVAHQGTAGDPYSAPARVAAMLALLASVLGAAGIAFGGGGDTGAGAAKAYDDRMGSDALRDRDLQSNSMVDSLDELVAIDTQLFGATRDLQITMKNLGETFEKIGALIFSSITGVSGSNYGLDSEYTSQNNSSIVDAVREITDIFSFMGGDVTADILGSVLGSTKVTTETLDQGLNLSAIITNTEDGIEAVFGTIEAETVALVKSESSSFGGLISSSSADVQSFFSELPEGIIDAMGTGLDQTLDVINDLVSGLGDAIGGIDLGLIFSNLSTDVFGEEFISLFELSGEEAGEAIGLYFSALSSDILGDVLPWLQEYSKAGEELADTMLRITGDTIKLSNSLYTVGLGLQDIIGNLSVDTSMFEVDPMAFIAQSIVDTSEALGIAQASLAAEKADYQVYGEATSDGGTQRAIAYANPELIDSLATEIAELQGKLITTSIDLIFRNTAKYENDINNAAAQAAEAFKLEVVAAWEEQLLTHFKDIEEFQDLFARFSNAIFSETELFNQSVTNATANITAGFTELLNSVDDFTAADLAATLEENGGDYGAALRTYYEQLIEDNTFNAEIISGDEIGTAGADLFATVVKTGAAIDILNEILETAADAIEDLNDQYIQQIALFGLLGKELDLLELAFDYSDAIQEAEETGSSLEAVEMLYGLKRLDIVKAAYEEINVTIEDAMSNLTASIVDVSKNLDIWDDVAYSTIKINKLVDQLKKGTTSVNLDSLIGSTDEFGEFIDAFTGIIDDLSTDAPTSVTEEIALVENLREEIINKYELETALIQDQQELFKNLSQEINNFLDSLIIGDLSPLTNLERLDEAQAQFLENAANIFSDDVLVAENAASNLLGSATELLDQASAFYSITNEYNKMFDLVFNTLEGIDQNLLDELANPADPLIALTETTIEKLGVLDDILVELKSANDQVYLDDIALAVTEGMLPLVGDITTKLTEIDEGSWTTMIDHLATISEASTATLIAINAGSLSATVNDQTGTILTEIGTPEVAVGTAYVPEDMLATIHQGEAIIPETMAQGMREGTLTMGVTQDNTEVVAAIRELTQVMAQSQEDIVEATHENIQVSKDIANNMVRSSTPKTRRMA